jgi:hypothetical protein
MATKSAGAFGADAHLTVYAGFGFVLLGLSAAVAGILLPQVRLADAAVHPAWGDEIMGDPLFQ